MRDRGRLLQSLNSSSIKFNPLSAPLRPPLRPSALKKQDRRIADAIALMGGCAIAVFPHRTLAQSNIVPDNTLGAESSVVVPNFNDLPVEAIRGGTQRGQNLFHSFQEFNVSAGRGAYFFSPNTDIQNILARVTGSNPSQILGTLGTFGESTPNLFLINPNGIIFGQKASLDVGGSFVATTANAIRLGDTGLFSASEPQSSNLLAINPNAFFYNQLSNQGQIINRSTATTTVLDTPTIGLQVPDGRSLLLVGGDVKLDDGFLSAPGGRVELGGVVQNAIVGLNTNGNELRLSFPTDVARANVSLTNASDVNVQAGGGGSIAINAQNLDVLGGSSVQAGISSGLGSPQSEAGDIEINATGTITVAGKLSFIANGVSPGGVGKGGDINITTGSLSVTDGGQVNALTRGEGDAGSVMISASNTVSLDGGGNGNLTGVASTVEEGGVGNAGGINITTGSLFITNGAQLDTRTFGQGNAGSVRITATDTVRFDGIGSNGRASAALSDVVEGAVGDGGDIEITTGSLSVINGAQLSASTYGEGKAGSTRIHASNTVTFDGVSSNGFSSAVFSNVGEGAVGDGGDIEITTGSLEVTNGAQLIAITDGQGNAGSVRISATDTVSFDGIGSNGFSTAAVSNVREGAVGDGGDIEITTGSLEVTNGAQLIASTDGQGNAGSVRISATDTVSFDGVGSNGPSSLAISAVQLGAVGDGGDIMITTGSLKVSNGALLLAYTGGQGNAGNVKISASNTVSFDGVGSNGTISGASSSVRPEAVGNGGDIEITTGSLEVSNGALLIANTFGRGNAGSVRITATDSIRFNGGGAGSSVDTGAIGDGGNIEITTGSLEVINGTGLAGLSTSTLGQGNAGSVKIIATDTVRFDGGDAFSAVAPGAVGDGGDIEITARSLEVNNGAVLFATTAGQGNAGNARISATDTVRFDGGDAFSAVAPGAEGDGGNIQIITGSLSLTDAFISSENLETGTAGDIIISTRQNLEANRSSIRATTQSGDGGNIRLQVGDLLLMRNDSNISTTAGVAGAGGDGGNININADFVVAVPKEDSDITANAFNGRGGNINITTQGIYGLTFRERDILASSDITASSQFGLDGDFQLDLLTNVDPSRGLAQLPTNIVDASQQIDRRCTPAAADQKSSFVVTGRGGLPPSPNEVLQSESVITPDWVTLNSEADNISRVTAPINPTKTASNPLVEAQSWVYGANGEVILTAEAPSVTPHKAWSITPSCEVVGREEKEVF
ncbi:two-partner secretion domain-containing protein [Allocoleopsis franciscana]|uniref:Filamentous hemagglutinin family N-terminal domain protein n=1 Tax=Allocoleopsis franciscana PCC 7113 TaxID=1173027 RepID=K9WJH3_9CYAN|nr:filamentous hemagglutinin N-terminal domain-containing protein [Allocoleopsis franciscana]AFZ19924.1 filamentous hemagglutinin family N-terminal domain protein [Allocoleopsis franciscana PCC 7113]